MQSQVVILSGGRDPHLLQVRNEVLKVPGYTVVSATSAKELISLFRAGDFDLVLLCHTFSNEDQVQIVNAVHAQSPSTPVLVVTTGEMRHAKAGVAVMNDPAALLNAVSGLTSPHTEHRRRRAE